MTSTQENITAYILLTVEIGREHDVVERISAMGENVEAKIVYGEYDVIVRVEIESLKNLERIVSKIRRIPGVLKTITLISTF